MNLKAPHILVIRLSAMGDIALLKPVLEAVTNQNPNLKISLLTEPRFKAIFKDLKQVEVLDFRVKKDYGSPIKLFRLFRKMRALNFDMVLDLHQVLRTKILSSFFQLSGLNCFKLNKGRTEKKEIIAKGSIKKPLKLTIERYADVFRNAGFKCVLEHKLVRKTEKLPLSLEALNKELKWIGIAPFAQHSGKVYPKTEELIKELSKNYLVILFGGGPKEEAIFEQWEQYNSKNIKSMAGKLNFKEELALMSNLDLMFSMDSGNMHLASNLGIPVVSFWGATHPYAGFTGYGQAYQNNIQRLDLDCRPCSIYGNKDCYRKDEACKDIEVIKIIQRIKKLLN